MTEPVTTSDVWRALLDDPNSPKPTEPAPGYYRTKLRRGGPWVAVRIWVDEGWTFCTAGHCFADADRLWPYLRAITPVAYENLRHKNETDPKFDPNGTVDLTKEVSTP